MVYLFLPLISIVSSFQYEDGSILFTALSCCICVTYDCYTRYDKEGGRVRTFKIISIGILYAFLACVIYWGIQVYISSKVLPSPYAYIPLAVAPLVGIVDLFGIIRDDLLLRRV